jgi:hypothetical protein
MPAAYMSHPQAVHLIQQQHQQQQQPMSMIPPTHGQTTGQIYQPIYQQPFPTMASYVNTNQQQMNVGMMGPTMMAQQPMQGPGSVPNNTAANRVGNFNNSGASNKPNPNQSHAGDPGNSNVNNMPPKKGEPSRRQERE